MSEGEERVAVDLGDDYYQGAYFSAGHGDYLVSRSRLERWEAAKAAYEEMQEDVQRVMDDQRERIREINAKRPKSQVSQFIQDIYRPLVQAQLEQSAKLSKALRQETDVPWLVTDAKIDRDEEERGL